MQLKIKQTFEINERNTVGKLDFNLNGTYNQEKNNADKLKVTNNQIGRQTSLAIETTFDICYNIIDSSFCNNFFVNDFLIRLPFNN